MFLILCMLPTAAKQAGQVRYTGTCKVRALSRKDSSTANQMGCSNMLQFDIVRCKHRNHMATFLEIINFLAIIHCNTLRYNTSSVSSGPAPQPLHDRPSVGVVRTTCWEEIGMGRCLFGKCKKHTCTQT